MPPCLRLATGTCPVDPLTHPRRLTDGSLANVMNLAAKPGRSDGSGAPRDKAGTDNVGPEPDLLRTLKILGVAGTRAALINT